MPRTDEGEFELILGNKQLLSVFFIVVVLLGIFFTMGYIVGKNSAPETASLGRTEPIVVDPAAGSRPAPRTVITPKGAETPEPTRPPVAPTPERTPTRAPATPTPVAMKPTAMPTPAAPQSVKPEPTKASGQIMLSPGGEPSAGQTYLQVVASTRPDCEMIADVLKRKNFSVVVAPGPSDKVFRVLVGPLRDRDQIAKVRTDLEAAGFTKPYLRKY
jgi:cell division septation protein DedD